MNRHGICLPRALLAFLVVLVPPGQPTFPSLQSAISITISISSSFSTSIRPHLLYNPRHIVLSSQIRFILMGESMASDDVEVHQEEATEKGSGAGKNKAKVPKRVNKAEREKLKREQLNDLFLDLADALEMEQPNNGKASILNEAARLLNDLVGQIDTLKKENASLLSESHYVTVEKNELKEENSVLETQIEKLKSEVRERLAQSKPDLNIPPAEYQHPETMTAAAAALAPHFSGHSTIDGSLQKPPPAVFVVPIHPDLSSFQSINKSNVSKPHARYPTMADSWPSQLLAGREV